MKTVAGAYRGLDDSMTPTGSPDRTDLGRLHDDAAVSRLLGMPRAVAADLDPAAHPALVLTGRSGVALEFRRGPGRKELLLTVTGGETDLPVDDIQATYRIRAFVDFWGEETELTDEIRLPPEARAALANRERHLDERREAGLAGAAPRTVFRQPPRLRPPLFLVLAGIAFGLSALVSPGPVLATGIVALLLILVGGGLGIASLVTRPEIVVDRSEGRVRGRHAGRRGDGLPIDDMEEADVEVLDDGKARVFVRLRADGGVRTLDSGAWSAEQAGRIAEAINDAVRLPEARRKLLMYRRTSRSRPEAGR